MQDLALAGKEIVLDAEALHGFKMAAQDGRRDELGDLGGFVAAVLDLVERVQSDLLAGGFVGAGAFAVPLRGAGVEVPAVVVERFGDVGLAALFAVGDEGADFGDGFAFELEEADDDVGNLDAGVVDVVLDIDLLAGGAEQADKGVAEDGVAEMADVGGLVGIDAGVLYE